MSDQPKVIDAEFEVVSPGRQAPAEYDRDPALRRFLLWAVRASDLNHHDPDFMELNQSWRLALILIVHLVGWAVIIAMIIGAARLASWGWHALGPVLGYRT